MGLVVGVIVVLVTLVAAFVVSLGRGNWDTGEGTNPLGGLATLVIGLLIAGAFIVSHFTGW